MAAPLPSAPAQPKIEPIESYIFSGLLGRLQEVFGVPTVLVNATNEIQAVKKIQGGDAVAYPYITATITSLTTSPDGWRPTPFLRRGVDTMLSSDQHQVYKVTCLPTDFVLEVTYKDNNFVGVMEFSKLWLFAARSGYLKFSIQYGDTPFHIWLILTEDIAIPKREADPTNISEFITVSTLTVKGWTSSKKLRIQQVATDVEVQGLLGDQSSPGDQVFLFQNKWGGVEKVDNENNSPIPVIQAVTPSVIHNGTVVTILGSYLNYVTAVYFKGVAAPSFQIWANNKITATTPNLGSATTGYVSVVGNGSTVQSPTSFAYS